MKTKILIISAFIIMTFAIIYVLTSFLIVNNKLSEQNYTLNENLLETKCDLKLKENINKRLSHENDSLIKMIPKKSLHKKHYIKSNSIDTIMCGIKFKKSDMYEFDCLKIVKIVNGKKYISYQYVDGKIINNKDIDEVIDIDCD